MPDNRVASGFAPTAKTIRPITVRLSMISINKMETRAKIIGTGIPASLSTPRYRKESGNPYTMYPCKIAFAKPVMATFKP